MEGTISVPTQVPADGRRDDPRGPPPKSAHTPGPWRWELAKNSKRIQLCGGPPKSGFGKYDLTVMSFARYGMSGAAPVFWTWDGFSGDPKRADSLGALVPGREHHASWFQDIDHPDARLIAAAPTLLEAAIELQAARASQRLNMTRANADAVGAASAKLSAAIAQATAGAVKVGAE